MAVKCVEHAQTYWNLLEKLDPSTLRLTKLDDEILTSLAEKFPESFSQDNIKTGVKKINEDEMKSEEGKKKWRAWMESWEGKSEYKVVKGSDILALAVQPQVEVQVPFWINHGKSWENEGLRSESRMVEFER